MFNPLKKLFKKTPPPLAPVEDYQAWRDAHPAQWAELSHVWRYQRFHCAVHDAALVTTMGYRWNMDCQPSYEYWEGAKENPHCLPVEEQRHYREGLSPARLVLCLACEAGMRARGI